MLTVRKSQTKVVPLLSTLLLFLALLLLMPTHSAAQETSADSLLYLNMDEIRVEATHSALTLGRASMAITRVNRPFPDILSRPAATLDELTFSLPGIWVSNRENAALGERMVIRGTGWRSQFGVRGIQVILDDIPLTVADGQSVMNMIDPAMIQSIELLRGPSATFWGNSSGGVLYLKTTPGPDAPTLSLRSYLGSYNTMKHEARWSHSAGRMQWDAYGSYYDSDGFRDYSASQLIRGSISGRHTINSSSNLSVRVAYAGMPKAQHPGSLHAEDASANPTMAAPNNVRTQSGKEYHQLMGSLQYRKEFEQGFLRAQVHGTYRDFTNPLPGPYIMVDRQAGGSRVTYDFLNLPFDFQMGAEYNIQFDKRKQQVNSEGQPTGDYTIDQNDLVNSQGVFAKAVFNLNRWTVSLGLRGDRMGFVVDDFIGGEKTDRSFYTVNPSAGINYQLFEHSRWFANFSTSFESPTTTELKNRLGEDGMILPGFNPDLSPERTIGFETGFRGAVPSLNMDYDLTGFLQHVRDQIIQETEVDGQAIFGNGGNARHIGLESRMQVHPAPFFTATLMYTYILAEFSDGMTDAGEDFSGNRLPGVAPSRFGATLIFHMGSHTISTDLEHVGEYYADSENSAVNPSYTLIHARWSLNSLPFGRVKVMPFISVRNILDERYNTSVAINNGFGRFYEPGSGRSLQAGVRVDFH